MVQSFIGGLPTKAARLAWTMTDLIGVDASQAGWRSLFEREWTMRRRDFVGLLGAISAWPQAVKAPVRPEKYTPARARFQLVFSCAAGHSP